jgi:hypothetical protein
MVLIWVEIGRQKKINFALPLLCKTYPGRDPNAQLMGSTKAKFTG